MDQITTPFGRRTLSLGMVAAQVAARDLEGKAAHKWKTFRAIAEAKDALGVSDRSLSVLNALLTCLPETALTAGDLVVFPSNKALSLRAHGMAETTLRRHLNALVEAGLVLRRDSPNGKRYAHRGAEGIEKAFGFDLSPILARAEEFQRLAGEAQAERRLAAMARERVTIYRRDIGKMIEAGAAAGAGGSWQGHRDTFAALGYRLPRRVTMEIVQPLVEALHTLATEIGNALESLIELRNSDGSDIQDDAHIENSKTETTVEIEPASRVEQGARVEKTLPLSLVLKACPDIAMYDKGGVRDWRDLITTASLVRGMLGISASAWHEATSTMGETGAAIVMAGILQRAEVISSPGGYLRGLTAKSRAGEFSAWPMMMALLRAQSPAAKGGSSRGG
ncbi:MAG: plasmid replication protein RepC [Janthinobacterium lividum]